MSDNQFNADEWDLHTSWTDEDGLSEWYEHSVTGECLDVDEFKALKQQP